MTSRRATATDGSGAAGRASRWSRLRSAHLVISVVLLAVFAAVFVGAQDWPFRTRLFPMMVAVAGAALALLNIVVVLVGREHKGVEGRHIGDVEITDEDDEEDEALEYVFETASRRDWARALGWVAAFFVGMYLLGAVVTIPAFALLYLLLEARSSVVVSAVYAAVLGGLVFGARSVLDISLPAGLLLGG